ncbi:sodium-dependent phosphate transporter, putative [Plasmodium sp. gorilla clade G2]|uniref:sodium-dependent phosphate transporter, putative n=1 Tax=Plasmodium sp. gorilla clade G2 TaxID=880535 RepID=UPI000D22BBBD|nr:sodium-dependent phosphate transporter, putative [Plasmodium sp. gorilla clade G2]SOV18082.1 sodium-dependent phosphate transporter, putative [Plasmodium sp. gorilla clade G2]
MVTSPDMLWLVITSGIACFFMAFVTGANDIANTFSTSIGSKAISIKKALIVAFFFEALGASLLGGTVTDSIRSKIINFQVFYDTPEFLMLGMCCALMGATVWLAIATRAGLPVSTTHSIIGALLGFGLATGNMKSIKWEKINNIVISWLAAPILAGTCSAIAFTLLRMLILRKKNSFEIIKKMYWFLIFLITLPFSVFLIFHNPIVINTECEMKKDGKIIVSSPCYIEDWSAAHSFYASVICIILSSILTAVGSFIIYIIYNKRINNYNLKKKLFCEELADIEKNAQNNFCAINNSSLNSVASNETQLTQANNNIANIAKQNQVVNINKSSNSIILMLPEDKNGKTQKDNNKLNGIEKSGSAEGQHHVVPLIKDNTTEEKSSDNTLKRNVDNKDTNINENNNNNENGDKNGNVKNMENIIIENFDPQTEIVFSSLQIISAILGVVAQSANDTANAIGPFAAVFNAYNNGIRDKIKVQWYILLFGGLSMSLGLSIMGYRVIKTVGMKLIKITPARGFTIELISGLVVLFFSICGIPLSSTHCAVSSVIGLGLVEAKINADNKKQAKKSMDKDIIQVDKDKSFTLTEKMKYPFSFLNTSCVNLRLFRTVFLSWILTVVFSATVTAGIYSFAAYSPSYMMRTQTV